MKLEQAARHVVDVSELEFDNRGRPTLASLGAMHEAITALRDALAEQSKLTEDNISHHKLEHEPVCCDKCGSKLGTTVVPCDCAAPMQQAEQEPVAFIGQGLKPIVPEDLEKLRKHEPGTATLYDTSLYAAPVRTKDLTDDEIGSIYEKHHALGGCWTDGFAYERAVIAKDREKNK